MDLQYLPPLAESRRLQNTIALFRLGAQGCPEQYWSQSATPRAWQAARGGGQEVSSLGFPPLVYWRDSLPPFSVLPPENGPEMVKSQTKNSGTRRNCRLPQHNKRIRVMGGIKTIPKGWGTSLPPSRPARAPEVGFVLEAPPNRSGQLQKQPLPLRSEH